MRRPNFCLCCCCRLTEYFINRVIWCGAYAVVEVVWPLLTSSSSSVSCSEVILLSTLCGRRLAQLCGLSLDLLGSSIWSSVFTVVSSLLRLFTALRKQLRRPSPIRRLTTVEKGDYYWKGLSLSLLVCHCFKEGRYCEAFLFHTCPLSARASPSLLLYFLAFIVDYVVAHRTTTMAYVPRPRPRPFLELLLFWCIFATVFLLLLLCFALLCFPFNFWLTNMSASPTIPSTSRP